MGACGANVATGVVGKARGSSSKPKPKYPSGENADVDAELGMLTEEFGVDVWPWP